MRINTLAVPSRGRVTKFADARIACGLKHDHNHLGDGTTWENAPNASSLAFLSSSLSLSLSFSFRSFLIQAGSRETFGLSIYFTGQETGAAVSRARDTISQCITRGLNFRIVIFTARIKCVPSFQDKRVIVRTALASARFPFPSSARVSTSINSVYVDGAF